MKDKEALKLALEALESFVQPDSCEHGFWWEDCPNYTCEKVKDMKAITAIKEALAQPELCKYGQEPKSCTSSPMDCQCALDATFAQPEQEPVAVVDANDDGYWAEILPDRNVKVGQLLYTTQPQRTWVGLTDEERKAIRAKAAEYIDITDWNYTKRVQEATELALQEKNK